jgi:hypothetical protein
MGISLVLTIIFEEAFALAVGIRNKKDLLLICLVNILTNPAVVFLYHMAEYFTDFNYDLTILTLEAAAILVEAYYFKAYATKIRHPFQFSLGVNVFSYGIGWLLSYLQ